ncbi:hypothetical protein TIFTF001_016369 [Ficus carica]|uniref:Uncharacterized protein n=1 Tax=Ficus carica TaxID=3494 RepID=A0AA88A8S0_FICCA|nr:hypothetical protein TIFTF001_016369 [Ficus carica]
MIGCLGGQVNYLLTKQVFAYITMLTSSSLHHHAYIIMLTSPRQLLAHQGTKITGHACVRAKENLFNLSLLCFLVLQATQCNQSM